MPRPKYNLKIDSGAHAKQTGKMMIGIGKVLILWKVKKTLTKRSVPDSILKRLGVSRYVYDNPVFNLLRNLNIPILGYYNWEIICQKE